MRGGSWRDSPGACRSASRGVAGRDNYGGRAIGFRVVVELPAKEKETGEKPVEEPKDPTATPAPPEPPKPAEAAPAKPEPKPKGDPVVLVSGQRTGLDSLGHDLTELGRLVSEVGGEFTSHAAHSLAKAPLAEADVVLLWYGVAMTDADVTAVVEFVKKGGGLVCAVVLPSSSSAATGDPLGKKKAPTRTAVRRKGPAQNEVLGGLLSGLGTAHASQVRWTRRPKGYSESLYITTVGLLCNANSNVTVPDFARALRLSRISS